MSATAPNLETTGVSYDTDTGDHFRLNPVTLPKAPRTWRVILDVRLPNGLPPRSRGWRARMRSERSMTRIDLEERQRLEQGIGKRPLRDPTIAND